MAVKITPDTTNNQTGEISIADVYQSLNDFIGKVQVSSADPSRNPVLKHYSFDVELDRIKEVIEESEGSDKTKIRINLSLNLEGQQNCDNTASIENYLSIIICAVGSKNRSLLKLDDMILVEGFKDYENKSGSTTCCVQGTPPYGLEFNEEAE